MRKKAPLSTSPRKKAKQLVKYIKQEQPNYDYLRELFRFIRQELGLKPTTKPQHLPYVPTEGEIKKILQSCLATQEYEAHDVNQTSHLYRDASKRSGLGQV